MELDHLFVVAQVPMAIPEYADHLLTSSAIASEFASKFVKSGFSEGSGNRHPGQGTANHRFFFDNFMLEFLFVDDTAGLAEILARQLGMLNRFANKECSPVGIASRRSSVDKCDADYAFSAYRPQYLPPHLHIQVAKDTADNEPLWFHLPFVSGVKEFVTRSDNEPRAHPNNATKLSSLAIELPINPSAASVEIAEQLGVELRLGERHAAHLVFNKGIQGIQLTLPMQMPLTIAI